MPGAPANGMIIAPWGSFASTADSIHTTHAERRAARQSSFTRTANATTPQVYRHARSHGLPGPALALHERECEAEKQAACEAEKQAAQDAADLRRDASRSRARGGEK